jgi:hypothetical protein
VSDTESLLVRSPTAQRRYAEAEPLAWHAYRLARDARRNRARFRFSESQIMNVERRLLNEIITIYEVRGQREQAAEWRLKRMDLEFPADSFVC